MVALSNDLYDIWLSLRFELIKHRRRKRILIIGALTILIPLLFYIPYLFDSDPFDSAQDFAAASLGAIGLLVIIAGPMFASDAVCSEFQNKTGLILFPTPQRRLSIVTGKYLAALVMTLLLISLYYLIVTLQMLHLFSAGDIPGEMGKSYLAALIYSSSAVSLFFFFGSLFNRTIASVMVGIFVILLLLPIITGILMATDTEPWFLVSYSASLVTEVLQDGDNGSDFHPGFGSGIAVMIVYALIFFGGSVTLTNRKEIS